MNDLQIFNNSEFGQIRTITIDNEPWFVGRDITDKLGYQNGSRDIARHVDEEDQTVMSIPNDSQSRNMIVINESGLYSLILSSKLPTAKKFKHWVTSEVLPSIRKNGSYGIPKTTAGQIQLLAQGHMELEQQIAGINKDLQDFKQDLPLLAVECEKITRAVRVKGMDILGGKSCNAYSDNSIRGKVYQDIHNEVKRQFGVNTYKAIKRSQCDKAIEIIKNYQLPMALAEEVNQCNAQINMEVDY